MAESIVSLVVTKLGDLIAQEIVFLQEVGDQLRSLRDELQWMKAFLKDADGSIKGGNERAKLWVNQVRDVAYDAEDIVDTYIYKIHQRRRRRPSSSTLTNCITSTGQLTILHELGNQIAIVKRRAEEISANRSKYGIHESVGGTSSDIISIITTTTTMSFNRKQNHLDVEEADVVGFDKHVKTLVKRLITTTEEDHQGPLHNQRRAVISIVGMGGLGKSTLAKKVCSNPDVKRHFDCQALVYVSQVFKTREILERIAKCAMAMQEKKMKELSQVELKEEICEYLKGRRYLVVLDDVWTRDAWDRIKDVLPEMMNGSRVLLTTRNADVGVHADRRSPLFKLQNLGEDESWDLFCKKAMCPSHLESIGKEMVAKCGGLPLAIVVLGGLVSRKEQTVVEWGKVLKSLKWHLREGEDRISPILDLSYHHLPYYLKPCFLYFAIYPEGKIIDPITLIRLWIAEGFIQARGEETLEEVAEDYLQELVQRSMIQVASERSYFENRVFYQVHDLILDLSISQAKVDNFLHVPNNSEQENILHETRRLTLNGNEMSSYIASGKYSTKSSLSLRTITCMDMEVRTSKMVGFLHDMKLLRVLNLGGTGIKKLPSDIGKLVHLRYLGLDGTEIKTLPSSIAELTNLQTLSIWGTGISALPRGIWKMGNNLRHLEGYKISIEGTPSSVESLQNLQTLSSVRVGPWLLNGLGKMTSLRRLSLREVTDTYAEPLLDCLGKLDNLNYLEWRAVDGSIVPSSLLSTSKSQLQEVELTGRIERLPESNSMNACITRLTLYASRLEEDPLVTLGKLGNLQFLSLFVDAFVGEEMVCLERGFPQLKLLVLERLDSLKRWKIEDQAMPKLRHLSLYSCSKLVMLPDGLERITSLQELTVGFMPDSFRHWLRVVGGEDWGKIQHIPSVTIIR